MSQYASHEELHVAIWRVQTNVCVGCGAYAFKRLRVQRCSQVVQTGYLCNRMPCLDQCVDGQERWLRRQDKLILAWGGLGMELLELDTHIFECKYNFTQERQLNPLFGRHSTPSVRLC